MLFLIIIHLLLVGAVSRVAISSPDSPTSVLKSCTNNEHAALLAFKTAFTISDIPSQSQVRHCRRPYAKTESWKNGSNNDFCQWDGVTCDPSSGHVTELDLSCSLLKGSFPSNSTLFCLLRLQYINLAYNSFSSSIPSGFGRLSELTYFNLSHSGFSGQVPQDIGRLSRLTTLDLSHNIGAEMSNFKAIVSNLSDLRVLDLSSVGIYSNLPPMIANLSKLVSLQLSGCGLHGELPAMSVLGMPKLRILNLRNNFNIYYDFSTFAMQWRSPLEVVDFSMCNFTGKLPDSVGESSNFSMRSFNIFDCKFHGHVPSWMWNVKEEIMIGGNRLSGTLPPTMNTTELDRLSIIDVSNNMITGMIPTWVFSLPSLNSLLLDANLFTGISQSSNTNGSSSSSVIAELSARDNQLQGQIPEVVFELNSLEELNLERNNLTGTVLLSKLRNLQNLISLDLGVNNLSIIDDMGADSASSWPNLWSLGLNSCNLGHFPGFLRNRENLGILKLSSCGIHGLVPEWFLVGMNSLLYLYLSHNSLTGGLENLPWQNMVYIDLSFNMLQGAVPIPPVNTRFFLASNNQFSGEIPSSVCDIGTLLTLDLSRNNLTGSIPICFANLIGQGLNTIDLRQNQLQDAIPGVIFEDCRALNTLSLSGNLLQGPIPQLLSNCMQLQLLDVGYNKLNSTFPYWLDVLPNLEVLILGSNQLKGPILISNLTNPFPKLRILDISNNHITGVLPDGLLMRLRAMIETNATGMPYMKILYYKDSIEAWIKGFNRELYGILDTLVFIDASMNMLEGTIPQAIGDLVLLRWLNLAHNNFTGSIPASLGNLSLLESLDLSFNRLDGQIPSELVNLKFLEFFNVSENDLVGCVPTSKQFDTFLDNSYLGNPRLCGELLTRKCGKKDEPPNSRPAEGNGSKFSSSYEWVIVLMGYGCGMFVGSVWGYFIFWERNYYHVRRLIFKIGALIQLCQRTRRQNSRS